MRSARRADAARGDNRRDDMTAVLERIDRLEEDVRRIDRELSDLRGLVTEADVPPAAAPAPPPASPRLVQPAPRPYAPFPAPPEAVRVRRPSFWSPEVMLPRLEAADLLGARGLALAGGVVTLLGVVFFFALAASNGWIGPVERVLLGSGASAIVFAAGVLAHARYGRRPRGRRGRGCRNRRRLRDAPLRRGALRARAAARRARSRCVDRGGRQLRSRSAGRPRSWPASA